MPDPRRDAAVGLRLASTAASTAVATAGNLAQTPHAWIALSVADALQGAAAVIGAGDDWPAVRTAATEGLRDTLRHLPAMERSDAAAIARGVVAVVSWVRRVGSR